MAPTSTVTMTTITDRSYPTIATDPSSSAFLSGGTTYRHQSSLPRLPIPNLDDTARKYLRALQELQDKNEHDRTKRAVAEFLKGDGPRIQQKLLEYAKDKAR